MSYFGFLGCFVAIPLAALLVVTVRDARAGRPADGFRLGRTFLGVAFLHVLLALTYTTPWDNYLVATGVWYYNPALTAGIVAGYVPLEEYLFFVLETALIALWWLFVARRIGPAEAFNPSGRLRLAAVAAASALWFASVLVFLGGGKPWTYLSITLAWALPAVIPQLAFGADILWRHRRLAAATIVPVAVYLSAADRIAIASGIWTVAAARSTGFTLAGLPVEEAIFFLLTAMLIGSGLTLALSEAAHRRLAALRGLLAAKRGTAVSRPGT